MPEPSTINKGSPVEIDLGDDFFWGVDQRDPRTLAPGMLNDGVNIRYGDELIPQTRKGVMKPIWANKLDAATSQLSQPWGTIYGGETFDDPNSTQWGILAADGYVWRLLPGNQPVSIPLPAAVAILSPCTFVQAFDTIWCFRGRALAPLMCSDLNAGFVDIVQQWNAANTYKADVLAIAQVHDEVAYGPYQAVDSLTLVGNTATVVTHAAHGFITGADVTIQGAAQTAYNIRANITVLDDFTFTYFVTGSPASPATGTITCSNNIYYWKALGSRVTLSSLTASTNTATATTGSAHGFTTGQYVTVSGATQTAYDGTFQITVTGAMTFTYVMASNPTSPATGSPIYAQTSIVLAGQSPDTNPEAWTRVYNILPNADNALYVNNQLLVPTAYQPSSADNYATFNGGGYAKKDYIVATDYLDTVHFDFSDEFRINQGSSDEIVDLAKFNDNTVVVWKGSSWGVLTNVSLDLSQLSLDMRSLEYGLCAMKAWALSGNDLIFVANKRGVVSIRQTENAKAVGVDLPLSAPLQKTVNRIDWTAAGGIRMANWFNKLYVALPLDNGIAAAGQDLLNDPVLRGANNQFAANLFLVKGVIVGQQYVFDLGNAAQLTTGWNQGGPSFPTGQVIPSGTFTATQNEYALWLKGKTPCTATLRQYVPGVNNAMLVYDFVAAAKANNNYVFSLTLKEFGWCGTDTGSAILPAGFFKMRVDNEERLFFWGEDGWVNIVEESTVGDQVANAGTSTGLAFEQIQSRWLTRSYLKSDRGQSSPDEMAVVLQTFQPTYSARAIFEGVNKQTVSATAETRDNTEYLKPWDAQPWVESNVNDDHDTPYREDYAVFAGTGLEMATGATMRWDGTLARAPIGPFVVGQAYVYIKGTAPNEALYTDTTYAKTVGPGLFIATQQTYFLACLSDVDVIADASIQPDGLHLGSGIVLNRFQEVIETFKLKGRQGRSFQIEITNTTGRLKLLSCRLTVRPGRQRRGIQV